MTNGSCHSTCESNVHTWLKPARSARCASVTRSRAGGSHWKTTPKSIGLSHLREAEVDLAGGRIGPAGGDHLGAGVERQAVGPVHVQVAEQRRLPAADRKSTRLNSS